MAAIREDLSGTSEKLLLSFSRIQKVGKRVASLTGGGMGSRPLLESAARASKAASWAMTEAKLLLEAAGATQAAAAAAEAEVKTVQAAATGAAAAAAAAEQATTAAAGKEMQAAEVVAQAAAARAQAAAARTQAEEVAAAARQAADTTAAAAAALGVGDMRARRGGDSDNDRQGVPMMDHGDIKPTVRVKASEDHTTEDETEDEITPQMLLEGRAEAPSADQDNREQGVAIPAECAGVDIVEEQEEQSKGAKQKDEEKNDEEEQEDGEEKEREESQEQEGKEEEEGKEEGEEEEEEEENQEQQGQGKRAAQDKGKTPRRRISPRAGTRQRNNAARRARRGEGSDNDRQGAPTVDHGNIDMTATAKVGEDHMAEDETEDEITPPILLEGRKAAPNADQDNRKQGRAVPEECAGVEEKEDEEEEDGEGGEEQEDEEEEEEEKTGEEERKQQGQGEHKVQGQGKTPRRRNSPRAGTRQRNYAESPEGQRSKRQRLSTSTLAAVEGGAGGTTAEVSRRARRASRGQKGRRTSVNESPYEGVGTSTRKSGGRPAPEGMVDVRSRKCRRTGCDKMPSYGVLGTKRSKFCARHALKGMVDVRHRKCSHAGCDKGPSYGVAGTTMREFCARHALEGMVDVRSTKCDHAGCDKRPSYGISGTKGSKFCARHALEGMVNLRIEKYRSAAVQVATSGRPTVFQAQKGRNSALGTGLDVPTEEDFVKELLIA